LAAILIKKSSSKKIIINRGIITSYDVDHRLEDKNGVFKLHYFAVNEHTKYKPVRCELNDDDKYPVKNPQ